MDAVTKTLERCTLQAKLLSNFSRQPRSSLRRSQFIRYFSIFLVDLPYWEAKKNLRQLPKCVITTPNTTSIVKSIICGFRKQTPFKPPSRVYGKKDSNELKKVFTYTKIVAILALTTFSNSPRTVSFCKILSASSQKNTDSHWKIATLEIMGLWKKLWPAAPTVFINVLFLTLQLLVIIKLYNANCSKVSRARNCNCIRRNLVQGDGRNG